MENITEKDKKQKEITENIKRYVKNLNSLILEASMNDLNVFLTLLFSKNNENMYQQLLIEYIEKTG